MADDVPGAAIYYEPDGYDTNRRRLMGRQAAGAGFLAGYARYGQADPLYCFTSSQDLTKQFAQQVAESLKGRGDIRRRSVRWLPREQPELLSEVGCLYYPSPVIEAFAWQRRYHDQRSYSLCGVTHTTATAAVMEAFGAFVTAPLQSWDAVICTSTAVRRTVDHVLDEWMAYLAERMGANTAMPRLQLPVIPLGVDCDAFVPDNTAGQALRTRLGIDAEDVVALFLGRLTASAKAHPMPMYRGLEAAASATGRKVHLILAGWFEHDREEGEFRALATSVAPSLALHIVDGRDPAIRRAAWSAADLFTSLSDNIQETFGLTPVEAMATGLPGVISEWNGYRETMSDGEHGFMVPTLTMPPGGGRDLAKRYRTEQDTYGAYIGRTAQFTAVDPTIAAEAYTRLVGDAALRRKLGEAGQRHARENFDWSVIIPRYEALWSELAQRRVADSESVAPAAGCATDPLRDDPAAVFAHYASRNLGDSDIVRLANGTLDFDAVIKSRLNVIGNRLMLGRKEFDALHTAIAVGEQEVAITVANLLDGLPPARHEAARRTLVWMMKMGLAHIEPAT